VADVSLAEPSARQAPEIHLGGQVKKGPRGRAGVGRWILRLVALFYLSALLIVPVAMIFWRTFQNGIGPVWDALTDEDVVHAIQVTVVVAGIAVVLNTIFGVIASFLLARHEFRGKFIIDKLIDLPLAVSPVIVGLALILVYGKNAPIGGFLDNLGYEIIFAQPGMVLATCFVSLPLVVRELVPVLEEIGTDQEQAAATLGASPFQIFRRITLPAIRWGLAYGVILTLARSLGEFGAVAVVSGRVVGETQTLTLYVQEAYGNFNPQGAYAAAFLLAFLAVAALLIMQVFRPKDGH
jgi:sulfate/thiosulfate transport system permease protein